MKPDFSNLRQKAEETLKNKPSRADRVPDLFETLKLMHELEVHQVELEMQNEKLNLSKEEALSLSRKYIELYDLAPAGYFTLCRNGDITELNLPGSKMLGKERSELINSRFLFFISEDTRHTFNFFFENVFQSETKEICEVTLNDYSTYIQLTGIASENREHCFLTAIDITGRKLAEIEKQILLAQKAESIGTLAGGIAHNFNNSLSVVLGNLEYLNYLEIENPEINRRIDNAKNGVNKMAALIKQLMAYAGTATYEQKELDIGFLISTNIEFFKTIIGKKNLLETDLRENLPFIKGDKKELLDVIVNLLMNAAEAIEENNGIIRISTGIEYYDKESLISGNTYQSTAPGKYVFIRISDNGCGMDECTVSKIFEPYFTTKFFGSGLSMPSAHGVLTSHLGGILIDSALNIGSTITVLLPPLDSAILTEKPVIRGEHLRIENPKFEGTLIVADDEVLLLEICSEMLEMIGFTVLKAYNGLEALEIYRANPGVVDGLILDLTMPGLGGVATAKDIRDIDKNINIIFISGYDGSDKSLSLDSVSYSGFLQKPYTMDNLTEIIASVFKEYIING